MSRIILVLALFVATAYSQSFQWGYCPGVTPVANFNVSRFAGKWYEQGRSLNIYETTGACQTSTILVSGTSVNVSNTQKDAVTQSDKILYGTGTFTSGAAKVEIKYPTYSLTYSILGTDYTSWAAVFACQDGFFSCTTYAWLMTRDRQPAQQVVDAANATFKAQGIQNNMINRTDMFWCFWA